MVRLTTWLSVDRSLGQCGNERIGREEEGTSSGRVEIGGYAVTLGHTPDHEDFGHGNRQRSSLSCMGHGSLVYMATSGPITGSLSVRGARSESNPYFLCIHLSSYNSYQLSITYTRLSIVG
jgi:hypothetical protein